MPTSPTPPEIVVIFVKSLLVAVFAGTFFFLAGMFAIFMAFSPVVDFVGLTARFLGLDDGGSFFGVVFFWSAIVFFVSAYLQFTRRQSN